MIASEVKPGDTVCGQIVLAVEPGETKNLIHFITGHNTYICIDREAAIRN